MHPQFASTHMRLAGSHLRSGDASSALLEYRQAARLRPNNCEIRARMTRALRAREGCRGARDRDSGPRRGSSRPGISLLRSHRVREYGRGRSRVLVSRRGGHRTCAVDGLLADFHLRTLHADSRWPLLLDRVGLTPYARSTAPR